MDRNIVQELCGALEVAQSVLDDARINCGEEELPIWIVDQNTIFTTAHLATLVAKAKAGFNEGGAGNNGKAV